MDNDGSEGPTMVNGTDVSGSPHADAVREFLAAEEPIVVEVVRRVGSKSTPPSSEPRSCSSASSSVCNDHKDFGGANSDFEISTCFNMESPIYGNKSIIRENENCSPSTSGQILEETSSVIRVKDGVFEGTNSTVRFTSNLNETLVQGTSSTVRCSAAGSSDVSDACLDAACAHEILEEELEEEDDEDVEVDEDEEVVDEDDEKRVEVDEVLYENDCIVNKCNGCECCVSMVTPPVTPTGSTSSQQHNRRLVSRSVQTHLTALNWIDEFEDCLFHIDFEELMARKSSSGGSSMSDGIAATASNIQMENAGTPLVTNNGTMSGATGDCHECSSCQQSQQHYTEQIRSPRDEIAAIELTSTTATTGPIISDISDTENATHNTKEIPTIAGNLLDKSPTNSFIRTQLESINEQIAALDNRMHKIHIVNKSSKLESESEDVEHIYETIQESEIEPIYSSPYEPEITTERSRGTRRSTGGGVSMDKKKRSKSVSAGSSGSGEGAAADGDSSSAYNTGTGGSSNSNHHSQPPLTFKLGCNHTNRSILQLCSPSEWGHTSSSHRYDNLPRVSSSSSSRVIANKDGVSTKIGITSSKSQPIQIPADTMYTNMANLHQTILLQQQLFRQALSQRQTPFREAVRSNTSSTFPGGNSNQGHKDLTHHRVDKDTSLKMEWKVKRRQNGTRYIARRPIRNRILRNRTKEIIEERAAELTTEDETCSEIKLGRYWTKEERKRQILERQRKLHSYLENGKMADIGNCKNCAKLHRLNEVTIAETHCCSKRTTRSVMPCATGSGTGTINGGKLPSTSLQQQIPPSLSNNVKKSSDKKSLRKKSHKDTITDDFKTVQEMIVNGNRATNSSAGKMIGLLSVTTV